MPASSGDDYPDDDGIKRRLTMKAGTFRLPDYQQIGTEPSAVFPKSTRPSEP
jgi:hypothetical protein